MIILPEHLHYAPLDGLRRLARSMGYRVDRRASRAWCVRRISETLAREALDRSPPRGGWSW